MLTYSFKVAHSIREENPLEDPKLTRARLCSRLPAFLVAVVLSCIGASAETPSPALRILGRTPLPPGHSVAKDIRWAGDNSVYVVRALDGVFEMELGGS